MMFFKKKLEPISRTNPGYEETERRTPKAGVILLVIMFIGGIFFGWNALDDLARIPTEPEALSYCGIRYRSAYVKGSLVRPYEGAGPLYSDYKDYNYYDSYNVKTCGFSEREKRQGIIALFEKRKPLTDQVSSIQRKLDGVNISLQQLQQSLDRTRQDYDLGLQERHGNVPNQLFPISPSQQSITELEVQKSSLNQQKIDLTRQVTILNTKLKEIDDQLMAAYKPVLNEYNTALRWYDFYVFLLQFVFVLPFFWLIFALYLKFHRKNSPYTVIFLGILAVASILFLRVILFWFWGLFLERVLETIFRWMREFELLRSLVFYAGMVLMFVIFGGAVYLLQKKIFDPRRVILRRFRARQCPHCQTDLNLSHLYCPNCGHQIREKCPQCGQDRFVNLPTCPHCGLHKEL